MSKGDRCGNCRYFTVVDAAKVPKMPGVYPGYGRCGVPAYHATKAPKVEDQPWVWPISWCDRFKKKEEEEGKSHD